MNRTLYEREIIVRLFQLSNKLQTFLDKILKEEKLTAKQFFMMIIIGTFDESPKISELAERFGTSHQNVKQVLLKLEKNGFVNLFKDSNDSRITRVELTEYAMKFWEKRNDDDYLIISEIFRGLEEETLSIFKDALVDTIQNIETLKG